MAQTKVTAIIAYEYAIAQKLHSELADNDNHETMCKRHQNGCYIDKQEFFESKKFYVKARLRLQEVEICGIWQQKVEAAALKEFAQYCKNRLKDLTKTVKLIKSEFSILIDENLLDNETKLLTNVINIEMF
jgi:uncharacterized protein (DUF2344 family)